ncbi:hypothetical protein AXY46_23490 [Achromobacter xylosoxidans]|nr:hypothetical protein AXY46_23490 [Achromobacter xylosoxidans]
MSDLLARGWETGLAPAWQLGPDWRDSPSPQYERPAGRVMGVSRVDGGETGGDGAAAAMAVAGRENRGPP